MMASDCIHQRSLTCTPSGSFNSSIDTIDTIDAPYDEDNFHRCKYLIPTSSKEVNIPRGEQQRLKKESPPKRKKCTDRNHLGFRPDRWFLGDKQRRPTKSDIKNALTDDCVSPNKKFKLFNAINIDPKKNNYFLASHRETARVLHTSTLFKGNKTEQKYSGEISYPSTDDEFSGNDFSKDNSRIEHFLFNQENSVNATLRREKNSTQINLYPSTFQYIMEIFMRPRTIMCFGLYLIMVTLTADLFTFSHLIKPWSTEIPIKKAAAYGVSHGREILYPAKAKAVLSKIHLSKTWKDESIGANDPVRITLTEMTDVDTVNVKHDSNNVQQLYDDNRRDDLSVNTFASETKHLRQPRLIYARTSRHRKLAPIFRPGEPLLKNFGDNDEQQEKDHHIEKYVFRDNGSLGGAHGNSESEMGVVNIVGAYFRYMIISCIAALLFMIGLREVRKIWNSVQAHKLLLKSQRSR